MQENNKNRISKFLSLVLRHEPGKIDLELDDQGWADVNELISKAALKNMVFSLSELEEVVVTNDKQRFAYNGDKSKIRANQGHSIDVELQLEKRQPPEVLYHGTVDKFLESIRAQGLQKMSRHHVHLSADRLTAEKVGNRRGKAITLVIRSGEMSRAGIEFYQSANGVWLADSVPAEYIVF